jgi:transcription elongation factor GreA
MDTQIMQKHPMTLTGAERLRNELDNLKRIERPQIIKAIAEARAHGDLKENAEYHAAKERQGFIEGKINDIEGKLSHAQIIDVRQIKNEGKVIFGATIKLTSLDNEMIATYQIVGEDEADLKHYKISVTSPMARAIIGKFEGDEVEVKTPQGNIVYEITKVEYL